MRAAAEQMAREWTAGDAGRSAPVSVRDFVAVGDVEIKVIGADGQILDSEVPVRQILEQLVAKTGLPPFLLGLSWSSTERMSKQQADLLTSELWTHPAVRGAGAVPHLPDCGCGWRAMGCERGDRLGRHFATGSGGGSARGSFTAAQAEKLQSGKRKEVNVMKIQKQASVLTRGNAGRRSSSKRSTGRPKSPLTAEEVYVLLACGCATTSPTATMSGSRTEALQELAALFVRKDGHCRPRMVEREAGRAHF